MASVGRCGSSILKDATWSGLWARSGKVQDMVPDSDLGHVLSFMQVLWELEQGLNRRSKAMLRRYGISGPQRLVVRVVGRLGPVTPASLARVLRVHPASVTRLARTLEGKGMVRRRSDPADRRQILLELGPEGIRMNRLKQGTVEHAIDAALRQSRASEVEVATRVLRRAVRRLVPDRVRAMKGKSA